MNETTRLIFGKRYRFLTEAGLERQLIRSIGAYPSCTNETADVEVHIEQQVGGAQRLISCNPAIFRKYRDSYVTDFGPAAVHWDLSQRPVLTVGLSTHSRSSKRQFLSRLRSMEYGTPTEKFEQILHELVLVPSAYFFKDRIPVHASAVSIDGQATLLAGSGGVGKTSAMLALRHEEGVAFVSDDIAVLSSDGNVYPNLAWPKIYGYNLGGTQLKSELFKDRGLLDRFHFNLRARMDPSRVRRKMHPQDLYRRVGRDACKLCSVLYLFRENVSKLTIEQLDPAVASEMTIAIMETEYVLFHRFLQWDRFNALASGSPILLDLREVLERWRQDLMSLFGRIPVRLLRIPIAMSPKDYINEMSNLVLNEARAGY